jgi:hypothetical protein
MGFYEDYKPFRNYMRRFSLAESLVDVWQYSLHILNHLPPPADYAIGKPPLDPIKRNVWPWELEILAREIVLNATTKGDRSLRRWNDLAGAINHIKRLDNKAYAAFGDQRDVLLEIHRIVHRQFPWQIGVGVNPLMRAFKNFRAPRSGGNRYPGIRIYDAPGPVNRDRNDRSLPEIRTYVEL